jgi:endonuclease YncB( thermonuclease family)
MRKNKLCEKIYLTSLYFISLFKGEMTAIIYITASFIALVTGVYDGDSYTARVGGSREIKIRLAELDAPELGQPWGETSREYARSLILNKKVWVDSVKTTVTGRIVARIHRNNDSLDIGRELLRAGMVRVYDAYCTDTTLYAVQATARAARLGLWGDRRKTKPETYRRTKEKR